MIINQVITQLKTGNHGITVSAGVSESTLQWFERQMGVVMADDFKAFYRFCNGFELEEDAFRILSLDEIVRDRPTHYRKRLINNRFYFAEYMQYCDMWSIEMGNKPGTTYAIFCPSRNDEQLVMTYSFADFLSCFLAKGVFGENGLYDWGDAVAGSYCK